MKKLCNQPFLHLSFGETNRLHIGEIVRQYGEKLRKYKQPLGELVSYEMGEIATRGVGRNTRND